MESVVMQLKRVENLTKITIVDVYYNANNLLFFF